MPGPTKSAPGPKPEENPLLIERNTYLKQAQQETDPIKKEALKKLAQNKWEMVYGNDEVLNTTFRVMPPGLGGRRRTRKTRRVKRKGTKAKKSRQSRQSRR